jgi:hypothetical protein
MAGGAASGNPLNRYPKISDQRPHVVTVDAVSADVIRDPGRRHQGEDEGGGDQAGHGRADRGI